MSLRSGTLKQTTTETEGDDVGVTRYILSLLSLRKLVAEQRVIVKDYNFISTLYVVELLFQTQHLPLTTI